MQQEAKAKGCEQVLWLYGPDHQLTEVGTMNIFVFWTHEDGGKPRPWPSPSPPVGAGGTPSPQRSTHQVLGRGNS